MRWMLWRLSVAVWLGMLLAAAGPAQARAIIYVDAAAPPAGGGGIGQSWAKAHRSLVVALKQANSGDKVRIAQGTYRPAGPGGSRTRAFRIPSNVRVTGGFAGIAGANPNAFDPAQYPTILSGDLNGDDSSAGGNSTANLADNSYHVVVMKKSGKKTQLRGMMITGGNADVDDPQSPHSKGGGVLCLGKGKPTIVDCVFQGNRAAWFGGGLHADNATPKIKRCDFRENIATANASSGGGAWIKNGSVQHSLFVQNQAGAASTGGGGLRGGKVRITDCNFESNSSAGAFCGSGSVIQSCAFMSNGADDGGGLHAGGFNIAVIDCSFFENAAASFGGGAFVQLNASASFINCRFHSNVASSGSALLNRGQVQVVNSIFTGNHSPAPEGAESIVGNIAGAEATLINCTIAHNTVGFAGAAVRSEGSAGSGSAAIALHNCILWGNDAEGLINAASQIFIAGSSLILDHCCVQGWSGSGADQSTSGQDPLLRDPAGHDQVMGTFDDDVRLSLSSPCRNAGNAAALPVDEFDLDGDGNDLEALSVDLDFRPRIRGGAVDIGAFELP